MAENISEFKKYIAKKHKKSGKDIINFAKDIFNDIAKIADNFSLLNEKTEIIYWTGKMKLCRDAK